MPRTKPSPQPPGWTCPACGRQFRRQNQGHTCDPAMLLDDRLDTLTPLQRGICEAILARLPEVGDVHVEPVRVGFFLKHGRTFASLRLRKAGIRLYVMLPRRLDHPRLSSSREGRGSSRVGHATTLKSAADVDEDVMRWLAESYASSF